MRGEVGSSEWNGGDCRDIVRYRRSVREEVEKKKRGKERKCRRMNDRRMRRG